MCEHHSYVEEKRLFGNAHMWPLWKRRLKSNEEKKKRKGERERQEEMRMEEKEERDDRGGRCHHLITRQGPCYGQV